MSSAPGPKGKTNGMLNVSGGAAGTPKKSKPPMTGKKVTVRRLPPGLTADEFWSIVGDEWKQGNGRVDWASFQAGKVSTNPSKPSLPARCALHVVKTEDLAPFSEVIQAATWEDGKRSFSDPALVGPPLIELAVYQKVPLGKKRADPRQGTIDQDPDYMAFLESLTQPQSNTKDGEGEQGAADDGEKEKVKVTSTALVEFIREKKANKTKEAATAKSSKHARQESTSTKVKAGEESAKKKGGDGKREKGDKAADKDKEKPKEPIKLLIKKAALQESTEAAKNASAQASSSKAVDEATLSKSSRRAGIAAAAKLLQRDLGLSPGSAHRRARQDAAKADAVAKSETGTSGAEKEKEKTKEKGSVGQKEKDNQKQNEKGSESKDGKDAEPDKSVPTGPKAAESSRRVRGNKGKASATEPARGKNSEPPSKPTTGPIMLLRKEPHKPNEVPNTQKPSATAAAQSPSAPAAPTAAAAPTPAATASPSTPAPVPPTGPKNAGGKAQAGPSKATGPPPQKKGPAGQQAVAPGATKAFVKHANASQGVTEVALRQAMETFGPVIAIEMDKRKGFAYVDFSDHEALCKAIAKSPVRVGEGTVQVLERKDKKPAAAVSAAPSSSTSSPAPAPATPSAAEIAPSEKTATEGAATPAASSSDRPKRGGRGRGRRGGGNGGGGGGGGAAAAAGGTGTAQEAPAPAAAQPSAPASET